MTFSLARSMLSAEILKLRRNRGLMAFGLVLSSGVVILTFGVTAVEHASNPAQHQPAGGMYGFGHVVRLTGLFFGALAGILIGSEAGTADWSSGVFRDLVATGRSRWALFAVRVPAAVIVTLALSALAYAIGLIGTFVFAGGSPTPSAGTIIQSAAWIALADAVVTILAVGVGSLSGSRAVTLTGVIGWYAIATPLLTNISSLGSLRDALLTPSLQHLMPVNAPRDALAMSTAAAVATLIGWAVFPTAIGAWRTRTREA
jgi:ABC-type transport system involved in multi-copper enzyme maturation permease subunit